MNRIEYCKTLEIGESEDPESVEDTEYRQGIEYYSEADRLLHKHRS